MHVDYTVYLVTDSTMIPESSTFLKQVEDSIDAGATIVQLREKSLSTLEFVERAQKVHELTRKKNIPLIINDRIDVALAVDAEGVHVGQDDMPAKLARAILGPNKILGVTCSNPQEVEAVVREGVADYVGIGTVYKTLTKTDTKTPLGAGPIGIRKMLQPLKEHNQKSQGDGKVIKCVAIGGISETNVSKVLHQCAIEGQALDGVAVVSCIIAKEDAYKATKDLRYQIDHPWKSLSSSFGNNEEADTGSEKESSSKSVSPLSVQTKKLREAGALVHHITNNVVKNFSANVTLSIGASPIMSELAEEYEEFAAKIPNLALVLNLGTPTSEMMQVFIHAIEVYNRHRKHIVFDPVAVGATNARLECTRLLLNAGQMSVIKGNVGEICAVYKLCSTYEHSDTGESMMRGVDSIAQLEDDQIINVGTSVSQEFKCIVVITGPINFIIDAFNGHVARIPGGSKIMGSITGSGCSLGSTIASFIAAKADYTNTDNFNIFEAVAGAVSLYNKAGRSAAETTSSPGTFMYKFLDSLAAISAEN